VQLICRGLHEISIILLYYSSVYNILTHQLLYYLYRTIFWRDPFNWNRRTYFMCIDVHMFFTVVSTRLEIYYIELYACTHVSEKDSRRNGRGNRIRVGIGDVSSDFQNQTLLVLYKYSVCTQGKTDKIVAINIIFVTIHF